jgi:hypothetical protein
MGKRIRYPKKKLAKAEKQEEKKTEEKQHFVLEVHNSVIGGNSKMGN